MNGLNEAIKIAGNQRKLAKLIGIWPQTVNRWMRRYEGIVPAEYVGVIYLATGVLPHKLRPDLHPTPISGIPDSIEYKSEKITNGALKCDLSVYKNRPRKNKRSSTPTTSPAGESSEKV